jgi:apolipoprotein N-acyltransferase
MVTVGGAGLVWQCMGITGQRYRLRPAIRSAIAFRGQQITCALQSVLKQGRLGSAAAIFLWLPGIVATAWLMGGPRPLEDAALLGLLAATAGTRRGALGLVLSVTLFRLSYPPLMWPTYWAAFTPLAWVWRHQSPRRALAREGFAVGFVMAWVVAPFVRDGAPTYGWIPQVFACFVSGVQMIGLAVTLRSLRSVPACPAALLAAAVATGLEVLQAVFGLSWVYTAVALPAAATPVAQWARPISVFGVSFVLYLINFLWLPDVRKARLDRWLPPVVAAAVAVVAWFGGGLLAPPLEPPPLSFSAIIVQPHGRTQPDSLDRCEPSTLDDDSSDFERALTCLTRRAIEECPTADLVIWPEGILACVDWPPNEGAPRRPGGASGDTDAARPATADDMRVRCELGQLPASLRRVALATRRPCLVGVPVRVDEATTYNSACLIDTRGTLCRHDKLALVPLHERLPFPLDAPWCRKHIRPLFGLYESYRPGDRFRLVEFDTADGRPVRLAVAICYEMYFPWLPQFRPDSGADAVVHLASESWADGDPNLCQFETWTCQYRAIESRHWQLVCTTEGNSAIIDPSGAVRKLLVSEPGYLSTCSSDKLP